MVWGAHGASVGAIPASVCYWSARGARARNSPIVPGRSTRRSGLIAAINSRRITRIACRALHGTTAAGLATRCCLQRPRPLRQQQLARQQRRIRLAMHRPDRTPHQMDLRQRPFVRPEQPLVLPPKPVERRRLGHRQPLPHSRRSTTRRRPCAAAPSPDAGRAPGSAAATAAAVASAAPPAASRSPRPWSNRSRSTGGRRTAGPSRTCGSGTTPPRRGSRRPGRSR